MATILFWVGVGLAPVAALLLLIGQSNGPLRIAAVLAIVAVVLIGLSITLRSDAESVRLDLEENLLQEIDELRAELRQEIANVARASQQAFGAQLQPLQANLELLRGQLNVDRADPAAATASGIEPARPGATRVAPGRAGVAVVAASRADAPRPRGVRTDVSGSGPQPDSPQTEAPGHQLDDYPEDGSGRDDPYGRTGGFDRDRGYSRGAEVGPAAAAGVPSSPPGAGQRGGLPASSGPYGPAGGRQPTYPPAAASGGRARVPGSGPPRPPLAAGVVRHTETVHVTTRQTIVGPPEGDAPDGSGYAGGGYEGGGHTDDGYHGRGVGRDDEWSGQPSAGYRSTGSEEDRGGYRRPRHHPGAEGPGRRAYDRDEGASGDDDPGADTYWADLRAGDRWASVRDDERGREVRMGERRAAMRADESGAELRMQDRWATIRQDEPWRDGRDESRGAESFGDGGRGYTGRRADGGWSEGSDRPAVGGVESSGSWGASWEDAEPEPVRGRRRRRDDAERYD